MSIGDLAARFGLATHVLRHWETMGLLTPARDTAGRRRYGSADVTRVAVILRAKEAGLSLEAIASLTTAPGKQREILRTEAEAPGKQREILRTEAEALRSRIAAAQASLELIECALRCDHEYLTECPNFQRMLADLTGEDHTHRVHTGGRQSVYRVPHGETQHHAP
ncbi:MerR family transcriptional regulator [Actinomadura welshii]